MSDLRQSNVYRRVSCWWPVTTQETFSRISRITPPLDTYFFL